MLASVTVTLYVPLCTTGEDRNLTDFFKSQVYVTPLACSCHRYWRRNSFLSVNKEPVLNGVCLDLWLVLSEGIGLPSGVSCFSTPPPTLDTDTHSPSLRPSNLCLAPFSVADFCSFSPHAMFQLSFCFSKALLRKILTAPILSIVSDQDSLMSFCVSAIRARIYASFIHVPVSFKHEKVVWREN